MTRLCFELDFMLINYCFRIGIGEGTGEFLHVAEIISYRCVLAVQCWQFALSYCRCCFLIRFWKIVDPTTLYLSPSPSQETIVLHRGRCFWAEWCVPCITRKGLPIQCNAWQISPILPMLRSQHGDPYDIWKIFWSTTIQSTIFNFFLEIWFEKRFLTASSTTVLKLWRTINRLKILVEYCNWMIYFFKIVKLKVVNGVFWEPKNLPKIWTSFSL